MPFPAMSPAGPAGVGGASPLDGPPPSPTAMSGGGDTPFSMRGVVPPSSSVSPDQIPPEMMTGIISAFTQVTTVLDAAGQALGPNLQPQIALIKDLIAKLLADVQVNGGGAISPTASGPAFPGGGMDRGIAGAGSV